MFARRNVQVIDHDRGGGKRTVGITAFFDCGFVVHVGRREGVGIFERRYGAFTLVADGDQGCRIGCALERIGYDERHGLAVVAHLIILEHGQDARVGIPGPLRLLDPRRIVMRQHGNDAGGGGGRAGVERDDAAAWNRALYDDRMHEPRERDLGQ